MYGHYFKVGDRVRMCTTQSKYSNKTGTVAELLEENYVNVQFDCNPDGHLVRFPSIYYQLEPENKSIQQQRGEDIAAYSEWFKKTYRSVIAAGGDPESFIDRLPPDLIDTMIRNNLHIEYKK